MPPLHCNNICIMLKQRWKQKWLNTTLQSLLFKSFVETTTKSKVLLYNFSLLFIKLIDSISIITLITFFIFIIMTIITIFYKFLLARKIAASMLYFTSPTSKPPILHLLPLQPHCPFLLLQQTKQEQQ